MKIFEILNIPKECYFLTGSRALDTEKYRYSTDISDYDYFTWIGYRHIILNYLKNNEIPVEFSCYNGGFKFYYEGNTYNIITGVAIEFIAWKDSLTILQTLINSNNIYAIALQKKLYRYSFYEQFRAICKTMQTVGILNHENK